MEKFSIVIGERQFELAMPNGGGGGYHIDEIDHNGSRWHCGQIVKSSGDWHAYASDKSGLKPDELKQMLALLPVEPWPGDPYYLTNDLRLLIRAKNPSYAIWEIGNFSRALFAIDGKNYGLRLAAGKGVTEEETAAAGQWLLNHLSERNINFQ